MVDSSCFGARGNAWVEHRRRQHSDRVRSYGACQRPRHRYTSRSNDATDAQVVPDGETLLWSMVDWPQYPEHANASNTEETRYRYRYHLRPFTDVVSTFCG